MSEPSGRVLSVEEIEDLRAMWERVGAIARTADLLATLRAYQAVVEAAREAVRGCPLKDVTWGPHSRPMVAVWAVPHEKMCAALARLPEEPV